MMMSLTGTTAPMTAGQSVTLQAPVTVTRTAGGWNLSTKLSDVQIQGMIAAQPPKILFDSMLYTDATANALPKAACANPGWDPSNPGWNYQCGSWKAAGIQLLCYDDESGTSSERATRASHWLDVVHQDFQQRGLPIKLGVYGYPQTAFYAASLHFGRLRAQSVPPTLPAEIVPFFSQGSPDWTAASWPDGPPPWSAYQADNDVWKPVLDKCDVALPDCYTHTDLDADVSQMWAWRMQVDAGISEAHRLMPGKPVYCFLQPDYTPELAATIAQKPIPTAWYAQQIAYVMAVSEGAVVWSWNRPLVSPFGDDRPNYRCLAYWPK